MAWGKPAEQKQTEQAAREDEFRGQLEAWAVGQAMTAHQGGDRFFQIQLPVSELALHESGFSRDTNAVRHIPGAGSILGRIEMIGWALEHVGYVFVHTGSNTKDMVPMYTNTVTKGEVAGIYLFRRAAA